MGDRASQFILLCEDSAQEQLFRAYLRECGLDARRLRAIVASRAVCGGNVGWVIRSLPKELEACRRRHKHATTSLIVIVDADDHSVDERRRELEESAATMPDDPIVMLIPKRHIETWIRAGLGIVVNETDSYKTPVPKREEIRTAAKAIHGWARHRPPDGCVDSLRRSLPLWRGIR